MRGERSKRIASLRQRNITPVKTGAGIHLSKGDTGFQRRNNAERDFVKLGYYSFLL